jgi:hypothetical protein
LKDYKLTFEEKFRLNPPDATERKRLETLIEALKTAFKKHYSEEYDKIT